MGFSITFGIHGKKAKIIGGVMLAIISLAFLISFICSLTSNMNIKNNYVETKGVVERVDVETDSWTDSDGVDHTTRYYDVWVAYEVDKQSYLNELATEKGKTYSKGDEITIFYDAQNPNNIRDTSADFLFAFVFAGIALITGGLAVFMIVSYAKDKDGETYYSVRGRIR